MYYHKYGIGYFIPATINKLNFTNINNGTINNFYSMWFAKSL